MSDIYASAQEDADFINGPLEKVPGWLNDIAGAATFALLHAQDGISKVGSFVEIGTYGGKYLSILARHAIRNGSKVLSLDPFFHFTPEQVRENITECLGDNAGGLKLMLHKCFSQEITGDDVRHLIDPYGKVSNPVRLFHIDGSHDYEGALYDIEMAAPLLTLSGIMVLDDAFSPGDIGVTEALFRYQATRALPLFPIAYVANKLFLCHHNYAERYREELEKFVVSDRVFSTSETFRERLNTPGAGRRMVETKLFGQPHLVIR